MEKSRKNDLEDGLKIPKNPKMPSIGTGEEVDNKGEKVMPAFSMRNPLLFDSAFRENTIPPLNKPRQLSRVEAEKTRVLFDNIARHLYLIYIEKLLYEKVIGDDGVEKYAFSTELMATFLKQSLKDLIKMDSLIPLLMLKKSGELKPNDCVGSYKIKWPSVKSMNDRYLGYYGANDFMEAINLSMHERLIKVGGRLIGVGFKGGYFVIPRENIDEVADKVSKVSRRGRLTLLHYLNKRIVALQDEQNNLKLLLDDWNEKLVEVSNKAKQAVGSDGEGGLMNVAEVEAAQKSVLVYGKRIEDLKGRIKESSLAYRRAIAEIDKMKTLISSKELEFTFGFAELLDEPWLALRNSECASNIAKLESDCGNGFKKYSDFEMFRCLFEANELLLSVVDAQNGVKDEWKAFFSNDSKSDDVRLTNLGVMALRKREDFDRVVGYSEMSAEKKNEVDKKIEFLAKYNGLINVIDILKKFLSGNYAHFTERLNNIVDLIDESQRAIDNNDDDAIRKMFALVQKELRVSLKDDGDGSRGTLHSYVEALLSDRPKVLIFIDHVDFGFRNSLGYAADSRDLMDYFETIMGDGVDGGNVVAVINENRADLNRILFGVGDRATSHIREVEAMLKAELPGLAVVNTDGGDESNIVLIYEGDLDEAALRKKLDNIATEKGLRIYAKLMDFNIPDLSKEIDFSSKDMNFLVRNFVVRIVGLIERAEAIHKRQKKEQLNMYINHIKGEASTERSEAYNEANVSPKSVVES